LVLWAILLCVLIVYYDSHHKTNPASPVIMGLCRVLVYFSAAAFAGSAVQSAVLIGAGCLLAYMIGLTYVAKQENLTEVKNLWPLLFLAAPFVLYSPGVPYLLLLMWVIYSLTHLIKAKKNIPRAVVSLIAGIS